MIGKKLQRVFAAAVTEVKRRRHEYLTLEHILYGMAVEESGKRLIEQCGGSTAVLKQALNHFFDMYMEPVDAAPSEIVQTVAVQRSLESALAHIRSAGKEQVEIGDLLAAMLEEDDSWAAFYLRKQCITRLLVLERLSNGEGVEEGQD